MQNFHHTLVTVTLHYILEMQSFIIHCCVNFAAGMVYVDYVSKQQHSNTLSCGVKYYQLVLFVTVK